MDTPAPGPVTLATLLKRHRDGTGESYAQIARKTGLSKGYIGTLAVGRNPIQVSARTVDALATGLGIPRSRVTAAATATAGLAEPDDESSQRVAQLTAELEQLDDDALERVAQVVSAFRRADG